jgi:hypothetical protein
MQADRRAQEKQELEAMAGVARHQAALGASYQMIDNFDPADFGFVCSKHSWQLYCRRLTPPSSAPKTRKAA